MRSLLLSALIASSAWAGQVTFNKDVLPILQKNCRQSCHRPGEIGPMPLLTYDGVRPWAKAIKAAALTRKMPPWFADRPLRPLYGRSADVGGRDPYLGRVGGWRRAGGRRERSASAPTICRWVEHPARCGVPDAEAVPSSRQGNHRIHLYCKEVGAVWKKTPGWWLARFAPAIAQSCITWWRNVRPGDPSG